MAKILTLEDGKLKPQSVESDVLERIRKEFPTARVNETRISFYDLLGVSLSPTDDEVKKASRKAFMKCHPDRNPDDKVAEEIFKLFNAAKEALASEEKRAKYNAALKKRVSSTRGSIGQVFQGGMSSFENLGAGLTASLPPNLFMGKAFQAPNMQMPTFKQGKKQVQTGALEQRLEQNKPIDLSELKRLLKGAYADSEKDQATLRALGGNPSIELLEEIFFDDKKPETAIPTSQLGFVLVLFKQAIPAKLAARILYAPFDYEIKTTVINKMDPGKETNLLGMIKRVEKDPRQADLERQLLEKYPESSFEVVVSIFEKCRPTPESRTQLIGRLPLVMRARQAKKLLQHLKKDEQERVIADLEPEMSHQDVLELIPFVVPEHHLLLLEKATLEIPSQTTIQEYLIHLNSPVAQKRFFELYQLS